MIVSVPRQSGARTTILIVGLVQKKSYEISNAPEGLRVWRAETTASLTRLILCEFPMKPMASTPLLVSSLLVSSLLVTTLLAAPAAMAQELVDENEIYRAGAWNVTVATFDDGSKACIANVDSAASTFSLWTFDDDTGFIGVYSPGLGAMSRTELLSMEIDRRGAWNLNNPEAATDDDIFVELGDDRATERVIEQIMAGRTLAIKNAGGGVEESFSLRGSSSAIQSTIICLEGILRR